MDDIAEMPLLPGEGEIQVIRRKRIRQDCEICGEPATHKHTFLLEGDRRNPASSAFMRDDCSWCEDERRFVCGQHENDRRPPDGYNWCATFPATNFPHMFLYWHELKE